jgi:hypothetical protein
MVVGLGNGLALLGGAPSFGRGMALWQRRKGESFLPAYRGMSYFAIMGAWAGSAILGWDSGANWGDLQFCSDLGFILGVAMARNHYCVLVNRLGPGFFFHICGEAKLAT